MKVVRAEFAQHPEFQRRFALEVAAARRVGGRWAAPVLDAATSKVPTGHLPRTMASLRNLAMSVFRQNGQTNIAAALRHTSRDRHRPLTALGLT